VTVHRCPVQRCVASAVDMMHIRPRSNQRVDSGKMTVKRRIHERRGAEAVAAVHVRPLSATLRSLRRGHVPQPTAAVCRCLSPRTRLDSRPPRSPAPSRPHRHQLQHRPVSGRARATWCFSSSSCASCAYSLPAYSNLTPPQQRCSALAHVADRREPAALHASKPPARHTPRRACPGPREARRPISAPRSPQTTSDAATRGPTHGPTSGGYGSSAHTTPGPLAAITSPDPRARMPTRPLRCTYLQLVVARSVRRGAWSGGFAVLACAGGAAGVSSVLVHVRVIGGGCDD